MRTLLSLLLLTFSLNSIAEHKDFTFKFDMSVPSMIYDSQDWVMVWGSDDFDLYLASIYPNNSGPELYEMHSMVVFPEPGYYYRGIQGVTKKIYSYGVIDCVRKALLLRIEYWVDHSEAILFDRDYSSSGEVVDLDEENTARRAVYDYVCSKT